MTWMAGRCGVVFGAELPFFWLAGLGLSGEPPPTQLPMLEKTRRVPWSEAFQKPSPHFQVITNTTQALADQVSSALEQQYADFVARFQIRKEPKQPLPIRIFAERAVELDPTAEVLDTLAECYFQDGQAQRAVETAKRALETQPAERKYFEEQLRKFEAAAKAK